MTDELTYGYEAHYGRHIWFVKGEYGAVHVWAQRHTDDIIKQFGDRYFGGIECHSRVPMYEGQGSHDDCWLLKGPCYHDGSSLQFSEQIEPYLPADPSLLDPENPLITSILHDRYVYWLEGPALSALTTEGE